MYCFEQILEAAPHKTEAVRPLTFYLTKVRWKDMLETTDDVRMNS